MSLLKTFVSDGSRRPRKADDLRLAERLSSLTQEQLLVDVEALVEGKLNYAALILFGTAQSVARNLAQAEVVFEYRSSDASGPAQERKEYRHGFFGFCDDLWERINKRNDKQEFHEGLFVAQISTFSERPVREAILNAICHRNYQLGGSIFLRQFPRRLEIDSPGGLPLGITLDNILDRQNPRNRRVAEILTKCGLVERSGQGMNLIYEELIKQSKPSPDFARTDQFQVGITLHGTVQDPAFVRFVEKVGKETTAFFDTHDWMIFAQASRGEKVSKGHEQRIKRLLDRAELEAMVLGDLLGPAGGESEELTERTVRDRYLVGVLAPSRSANAAAKPAVDEEEDEEIPLIPDELSEGGSDTADDGKTDADTPVTQAHLPSSFGMSVLRRWRGEVDQGDRHLGPVQAREAGRPNRLQGQHAVGLEAVCAGRQHRRAAEERAD